MTRAEHLAWCKQRAMEYVEIGDLQNAVTSMLSDLNKHEETSLNSTTLAFIGMMEIQRGPEAVKRWIEGFN